MLLQTFSENFPAVETILSHICSEMPVKSSLRMPCGYGRYGFIVFHREGQMPAVSENFDRVGSLCADEIAAQPAVLLNAPESLCKVTEMVLPENDVQYSFSNTYNLTHRLISEFVLQLDNLLPTGKTAVEVAVDTESEQELVKQLRLVIYRYSVI